MAKQAHNTSHVMRVVDSASHLPISSGFSIYSEMLRSGGRERYSPGRMSQVQD